MSKYSYGQEKIREASETIRDSKGSRRDAVWDAFTLSLQRLELSDETVPAEFHGRLNAILEAFKGATKATMKSDVVVDLTVEIQALARDFESRGVD